MNLRGLARDRRLLTAFWGTTVVQVAAVAFDVKILKQASKVSLMPLLWSWSRSQDAPPLLQAALLASECPHPTAPIDALGPARVVRHRRPHQAFKRFRAITTRCTWLVPS